MGSNPSGRTSFDLVDPKCTVDDPNALGLTIASPGKRPFAYTKYAVNENPAHRRPATKRLLVVNRQGLRKLSEVIR